MTGSQDPTNDDLLAVLVTVRDWWRYAVSRFSSAKLSYGHGTENARDEAAFLILTVLDLPIDDISPWLDARLTDGERRKILGVIEARIATRKPAPYLTNTAWIGPYKFYCDERTIVPRSFIGELLVLGADGPVADIKPGGRVLDLCTGSGCLAIIAADVLQASRVDAVDISAEALEVARRNIADYGVGDVVKPIQSDLFGELGEARYDLILANPPYVTAEAIAKFPPEYAAEPVLAHAGGEDGLDIVLRILDAAHRHLTDDGTLIVEVGNGRAALEQARPDLPFLWFDTENTTDQVFGLTARDVKPRRRAKATNAKSGAR